MPWRLARRGASRGAAGARRAARGSGGAWGGAGGGERLEADGRIVQPCAVANFFGFEKGFH